MMYYLKQEPGSFQTCTIKSIASKIEVHGALTREDVIHSINSFIRLLEEELVQGNKVKVDGLGIFHITTTLLHQGRDDSRRRRRRGRPNGVKGAPQIAQISTNYFSCAALESV